MEEQHREKGERDEVARGGRKRRREEEQGEEKKNIEGIRGAEKNQRRDSPDPDYPPHMRNSLLSEITWNCGRKMGKFRPKNIPESDR